MFSLLVKCATCSRPQTAVQAVSSLVWEGGHKKNVFLPFYYKMQRSLEWNTTFATGCCNPQNQLLLTVYFYFTDKRLVGKPFIIEGERIFCGDHVSQS